MKSRILKILLVFLVAVFMINLFTFAANEDENSNYYDNDHFIAEESVNTSEIEVHGNLFVFAKAINMTNVKVSGSIFVAGQTINISNSEVGGSIYVAGQDIKVAGTKVQNIYSASATLNIDQETTIKKALYCAAGEIEFAGKAESVHAETGDMKIVSSAVIEGICNVSSDKEPEIAEGAKVGTLNFEKYEEVEEVKPSALDKIIEVLGVVLFNVIIAILIIKLTPKFQERTEKYSTGRIIINALIGLLTVIVMPILSILLLVTGLFSILGLVLLVAFVLICLLSTAYGIFVISAKIADKLNAQSFWKMLLTILVTSAVVEIIKLIPVLGGILGAFLFFLGLGTIPYEIFSKKEEKTEIIENNV